MVVGYFGDVQNILQPDRRLRVGKSDSLNSGFKGREDQLIRRDKGRAGFAAGELVERFSSPGDFQVMAATAAETAAITTNG